MEVGGLLVPQQLLWFVVVLIALHLLALLYYCFLLCKGGPGHSVKPTHRSAASGRSIKVD